ncbi:hypothetical protein O1V66_02355 [Rouxiella chamberiensis]|uniref:Uncharacterized protein n=1 Tax=Rouxiella chamberiensis TaxID=1513468 RepID=A0ABY7HQX0_9GAMM|nr:hypothetical protein [Rouxiella chamberiensis]WAT01628.1 hypothetical protein O1V66_02355 [Rouxiella chamberiensis]
MKSHPNKHIQSALDYAVKQGWIIVKAGKSSHTFCKIRCGISGHTEHMKSIWSTPRNPENFARQIRQKIDDCFSSPKN